MCETVMIHSFNSFCQPISGIYIHSGPKKWHPFGGAGQKQAGPSKA